MFLLFPQEPGLAPWRMEDKQSAYRVTADSTVVHEGRVSAHIHCVAAGNMVNAGLTQHLLANDYRGKRVRYSAWFKTSGVAKRATDGMALFMRIDGQTRMLGYFSTAVRLFHTNAGWEQFSIVFDIPEETMGVTLGVAVQAAGDFWVDDGKLEVVSKDVDISSHIRPQALTEAMQASIRKQYIGAATAPSNLGFETLR
jgi:hypothetical protein